MNVIPVKEKEMRSIIVSQAYQLMGLGAPIEKDDKGFNKPDWNTMINLVPSMSFLEYDVIDKSIFAFVADTLVKYVRQIPEPLYSWIKEYAKENYDATPYYQIERKVVHKTIKEDFENVVRAQLNDTMVELWFEKFNQKTLDTIKTIPNIRPRKELVGMKQKWYWCFPLALAKEALEIINTVSSSPDLEEIIDNNEEEIEFLKNTVKIEDDGMKPRTIYASLNGDRLFLRFKNDRTIREAVKGIDGRRWHPDDLAWSVPVNQVSFVYDVLKNMGLDVESMVEFLPNLSKEDADDELNGILMQLDKYDTLFDHQRTGIAFLLRQNTADTVHLRGKILADDMGLGKTRQSIIAAKEAMDEMAEIADVKGEYAPEQVLVICPASLKLNWEREIKMVYPRHDVFIVNGKGWDDDEIDCSTWVVVNYDILKKYEDKIVERDWAVVICDEAHYLKNREALRSKIVIGTKKKTEEDPKVHKGIANTANTVFLLTGTPVTSRPIDLFNLLRIINHPLANNWRTFTDRYCAGKQGRFGRDVKGSSNLFELHQRMKGCLLRRTKEECLDMPEKMRNVVPVTVNLDKYMSHWYEYLRRVEEEGRILQAEHLVMLTKLKQAAAIEKASVAIERAEEIIEAGHKVILFTNFTEVIEIWEKHFGNRCVKVVGGMSAEKKQIAVDAFQNNPEVEVFLGNLQAAGVGLTLTAATYEIMNDYSWIPSDHLQAEDRAYRIGQKNNVTVLYLDAVDTIDEMLSNLIAGKLETITAIMEGKEVTESNLVADLVTQLWGKGAI